MSIDKAIELYRQFLEDMPKNDMKGDDWARPWVVDTKFKACFLMWKGYENINLMRRHFAECEPMIRRYVNRNEGGYVSGG